MDQAVRRFQARHGLNTDGIVGSATLQALNAPTVLRVEQIRANLERWRWLPQELGARYVIVNIADFHLEMVQNSRTLNQLRIVVGRSYRHTPVFSGTMTYLEVNPYWHIPPKIAKKDILPKVKQDPNYFSEQGIRVFESWKADAGEIDPMAIDWEKVNPRNFSYKLRQDPGPLNALGRIKFMFPNRFDVYLHDTPSRDLFEKTRRTFSSGCVRVENPMELAAFVVDGDRVWTPEAVEAAIESGETRVIPLQSPVPVHILYWTAWVDDMGEVQFREDVYGRDKKLREALNKPPPDIPLQVPFHRPR
jgi:murein L,D-transpeptidase YcbB/YkuD